MNKVSTCGKAAYRVAGKHRKKVNAYIKYAYTHIWHGRNSFLPTTLHFGKSSFQLCIMTWFDILDTVPVKNAVACNSNVFTFIRTRTLFDQWINQKNVTSKNKQSAKLFDFDLQLS